MLMHRHPRSICRLHRFQNTGEGLDILWPLTPRSLRVRSVQVHHLLFSALSIKLFWNLFSIIILILPHVLVCQRESCTLYSCQTQYSHMYALVWYVEY